MTRCKFKQGQFNCGSYAFNLYKEGIDQSDYCDHHYWQDQAMKARADQELIDAALHQRYNTLRVARERIAMFAGAKAL